MQCLCLSLKGHFSGIPKVILVSLSHTTCLVIKSTRSLPVYRVKCPNWGEVGVLANASPRSSQLEVEYNCVVLLAVILALGKSPVSTQPAERATARLTLGQTALPRSGNGLHCLCACDVTVPGLCTAPPDGSYLRMRKQWLKASPQSPKGQWQRQL